MFGNGKTVEKTVVSNDAFVGIGAALLMLALSGSRFAPSSKDWNSKLLSTPA